MATRIDGFLNLPSSARPEPRRRKTRCWRWGGARWAAGWPCAAWRPPWHAAYVDQPAGHMLEDPRYLGAWEGAAAFVCADAIEYFEGKPDWRIHQAVLYLDAATWTVRGVWRLEGRARAEKNWVPLGEISTDGHSRLLYMHDTMECVELDHAARAQRGPAPKAPPAPQNRKICNNAVGDPKLRGGTPLLPRAGGGWWGLAHVQEGGERKHPYAGWTVRHYTTTMHWYTPDLAVESETPTPRGGGNINLPPAWWRWRTGTPWWRTARRHGRGGGGDKSRRCTGAGAGHP